jgi:hypothetical protein
MEDFFQILNIKLRNVNINQLIKLCMFFVGTVHLTGYLEPLNLREYISA